MIETKPYGSWTSSLTAEKLADKGIRYGHMCVDGDDVYWLESRAKEKGRNVLVKCNSNGGISEPLPISYSVRSKVHEYGSGDFLVKEGILYFSNYKDQCIYRFALLNTTIEPQKLTEENSNGEDRYADYCLSTNKKYLVCVRERHQDGRVDNELVCINLSVTEGDRRKGADSLRVIRSGFDFYTFPRFNPQSDRLCCTCWNQPDMPWDAAELWVADFQEGGNIDAAYRITGGHTRANGSTQDIDLPQRDEQYCEKNYCAIYQPSWDDKSVLHYVSDASGWTNLYSHHDGLLNALTPIDKEFGIPQWSLASSTYAIGKNNKIYAVYIEKGEQFLCQIDTETGKIETLVLPFNEFGEHLLLSEDKLYFRAAGASVNEAIYRYETGSNTLKILSKPNDFPLPEEELSIAQSIEFISAEKRKSYAFYYQPHNIKYQPTDNTNPPLIVMSHGGPTGMTSSSLNAAIQFWTHRGFAVVDVNYGGSTGYGNKYRNSLKGNWGVVDAEDCIAAAQYLVNEGKADKNSLLIRGGSAGGYTTLCALTFHDVFTAGCSRYGVADLESLASDSHKFEARYLDSVVGPYPKEKALYRERSPVHHTEQLSCPILLLQGKDDKVVPPNQAEMMVKVLKEKGIPYAYRLYEGEGHGFRKAETIIDALNSELSFYRQVLEIDDVETNGLIKIKN
ncbi:MAG: prolyl oligopeptidase family serine peptidase [Kangiellaceae bacterium]|nr:prolyl oligopeptidase family serine peptidase [Kangiellaceae bacterium]